MQWTFFGFDVAASGDALIVGAKGHIGNSLVQTQRLVASDGQALDHLGLNVKLDAYTAIAGVPDSDMGSNVDQGVAYVFAGNGISFRMIAQRMRSSLKTRYVEMPWVFATSPIDARVRRPNVRTHWSPMVRYAGPPSTFAVDLIAAHGLNSVIVRMRENRTLIA